MKYPKLEPPLRTVLLYLFFGGLWILLSDRIVFLLVSHDPQTTIYQTLKGWFFILVSGSLLYVLLLIQRTKDSQAETKSAWLASFPERNPNPIAEIDSTGTVFYTNPVAQKKFPDLRLQGFSHPWLAGLEDVIPRFQEEGTNILQREIQVDQEWYSQSLYYLPETRRLRVYGADITERKQAEQRTIQMKRLYATLSQVNQMIVRVKERGELFQTICDVTVKFGEFSAAWIGLFDEASGEVHPVVANGPDAKNWSFPAVNIHTGPHTQGPIAQAIRGSKVITSENLQTEEDVQMWHNELQKRGWYSAAVIPFRLRGKTLGILILVSQEKGLFNDETEVRLLDEMGLDISFALETMEREAQRKDTEEQLHYQAHLLENVNDAIIAWDEQFVLRAWNLAAERIYGWKAEEVLGKNGIDILQTTFRETDAEEMRQHIATLGRYTGEATQLRKGGTRIDMEVASMVLRDDTGKITGYVSVNRDITERKQAEAALRAGEERFRLLFENNHAVMLLIEPVSGAIRNANPAAARFYGYSLSELRAMNINEINQLAPEEVYAERMRALKEERNYFHFRHRLSNGEVRSVEVHSAPVEMGDTTLLFSIIYDITERQRAEEEKQARARQLAALLDASRSLTESLNLPEVLQKIVDKAANVLGVETTAIYRVEGEHLYLGAASPSLPAELPDAFRRTRLADHPHIAEALNSRDLILLPDAASAVLTPAEQEISDALGLRTIMYVPLAARKDAADVLILGTVGRKREFSADEQDVARALSNHAALAIANAKLYQDTSLHLKELEDQIAGRKQAQEQFHLVVEAAPNGIMLIGNDGKLGLVNAQVEHYFGYDRDELIGMNIEQLIPVRYRDQHRVHISSFLASPYPRPMGMGRDLYGLRKDGSEFPAEIGLTPLESSGEALVMVTIVDITARKQAEENLRRHINYLTGLREVDQAIASSFDVRLSLNILVTRAISLLNADAVTILMLDPVTNMLEYGAGHGFRVNPPRVTSIRLSESYAGRAVLERRIVMLPNLMYEPNHFFRTSFLKEENIVSYYGMPLIVKGKVVGVMEVFNRTPVEHNQEWFDILNSLAGQAAIAIDNARLWEQVQRHARDLELRVAERTAALNRTNAELEHANRAKDEFLANMSHELRTPLNSILGLAESLLEQRRDPLTDYQQRSLQLIESSGQHLLELINDILDLSKIEAGKFDYYPQRVEIDTLCRASLAFVKSQAARKLITISYKNEVSIANILADPRRLKQILVNLLSNAVKFTLQGGQVSLLVHADEEQDFVEIAVTDSGIGIAPQDLKRLFQPFVQVDSKLNRQFEGTGLGLALVQKLTDMHGGSVFVESEVGVGSCFTVRLPVGQFPIVKPSAAESISEPSDVTAHAPPDGSLVLLAEDNLASIVAIGDYLKSHGYRLVEAHDGLEAIEKTEANDPSIILMDIQMPVLDGLEAIRRLRTVPRFAATPIISLTALAMPGDRERCLEAGADEYMAKPVRLKVLKQTIEKLLQGSW